MPPWTAILTFVRCVLGLVVIAACGRVGFDPAGGSDDGIATCGKGATESGSHPVALCAGRSRYTLPALAGSRIKVQLELGAANVTSADLALESPDATPLGGPVWTPILIEASGLTGVTGDQQIVIDADRALDVTLSIEVTPPQGRVFHVSPDGDDAADGSENRPWQTWDTPLRALQPGDTLIAHDGTWSTGSCSGHNGPCLAGTAMPDIDCNVGVASGTQSAPITVLAQHQRQAHLAADGRSPAFRILRCSSWVLDGIHASSRDTAAGVNDGAVVTLSDVPGGVARNLLLEQPNRCQNFEVLGIGGAATVGALIEDNEIYAFHRHGIIAYGTTSVTMRRNFIHSRDTPNLPCYADGDPDRGDDAVNCFSFLGPTHCTVENLFAENIESGVADSDSVELHVRGSLVRDAYYGLYAASLASPPAVRPGPIDLTDFVCLGCDVGIWNRGVQLVTSQATLVGGRPRASTSYGVGAMADAAGGTTASFVFRNVLTLDNTTCGFCVQSGVSGLISHGNAFASTTAYQPNEPIDDTAGAIQQSLAIEPTLVGDTGGSCLVRVSGSSNMATAGEGGLPIGANIVYRIEDGVTTDRKLWNQRTGEFPCGAIVAGVNDVAGASCFDAHTRMRVGVAGCPIP